LVPDFSETVTPDRTGKRGRPHQCDQKCVAPMLDHTLVILVEFIEAVSPTAHPLIMSEEMAMHFLRRGILKLVEVKTDPKNLIAFGYIKYYGSGKKSCRKLKISD
jgi:hypothetical protein